MEYQTEVVVVGAGAAGFGAALSLVDAGKNVIMLEKGNRYGGAGMFGAEGLFAVGSKLQQVSEDDKTRDYTLQDAIDEMLEYTHHRSNARMTRAILGKSAETITWLQEHGMETELVNNTQEVHQDHAMVYHQYIDKFAAFDRMKDYFEAKGGILLTETAGQDLIYQESQIKGIKALKVNNETIEISCQAVVLADGGFVGNEEMVSEALTIAPEFLYSMGERKATGDSFTMLEKLGVETRKHRYFENHAATVVSKTNPKWRNMAVFTLTNLPFLWVDAQGKRFANEEIVYDFALWGNAVYTVGGRYYFLMDQAQVDFLKTNVLDWTHSFERTFVTLAHQPMTHQVGPFPTLDSDLEEAAENGAAFKASSLQELAEQIGCSFQSLKETVETYNAAIQQKSDAEFGKSKKFLKFPITEGPFYAVRPISTSLGTIGGIPANEDFQVLFPNQKPLMGAFVAGNNATGMYDNSYPTLEGISCAFAWNSGRIAGESVVKLLDQGVSAYYC
ncbi:FAD-dependent oxidoreductase [Streptococcus sp. H31]|uniref:FAD-dependent oxidoreductase n=1 Tax=Streptococcus huangxiaojuni TaxID=3237239 RepID=UPI0034A52AC1